MVGQRQPGLSGEQAAQVNILLSLTDIGPGDGGTMILPGSHKSKLPHPQTEFDTGQRDGMKRMDNMEGIVEVHLNRGEFVDQSG